MGQLAQVAQQTQTVQANPAKGLTALVERPDVQAAMRAVIPKSLTPERLTQICISSINQTPKLAECTPASVLSCVMKCSQIGLEPSNVDGLGMCYILPYRNHGVMQAQFVMGYRGYIELARRSGQLKSIHAQAVYEGDDYDTWEDETGQHFKFRANPEAKHEDAKLRYVFCTAHLNDGGFVFEQMSKAEVDDIRKRSKASNVGPWVTDYEMMARKTVIRRASRYLPMSTELQQAATSDGTTPDYSAVLNPVVTVPDGVDAETGEVLEPEPEQQAEQQQGTQEQTQHVEFSEALGLEED